MSSKSKSVAKAASLIPPDLPPELVPVAREVDRIHESAMWSAQGQFEQTKLWRGLNLLLGVPAAVLAAISGATGLAADTATSTPAVLALISAGFGAGLTTLNPSRRVTQSQASANAYLEVQTAARQLLSVRIVKFTFDEAVELLESLTERRDGISATADPPSTYAYWRARRNIARAGGQTYDIDKEST